MSGSLSPAEDAGFGFRPVAGGSGEVVISSLKKAIVSFLAGSDTELTSFGRVAVICDGLIAIKNGYPNEEPRPHIPRFKTIGDNGSYFPIAKILNNDWAEEISEDNKHRFPDYDYYENAGFNHFVFQFKETTTEILCSGTRVIKNLDYEGFFEIAKKELYG